MKRLIKSELVKLLKSRTHLILIILLTLSTVILTYLSFKDYGRLYDDLKYYENFSGDKIDSISAAKIVDETLHQYAGKWSENTYQQIKKDYLQLVSKYPRQIINDEAMKKVYGDNYKTIMDKSLAGELTEDEFEHYMSTVDASRGYSLYGDEEGHCHIQLYYNEDGIYHLLSLIYTSPYFVEENDASQTFDTVWEENDYIFKHGEQLVKDNYSYENSNSQQLILQDYLISQVHKLPQTFDSVVPNNLFLKALRNILWAPLFVVIILLANVFGIEKQYKMDEIIYPTSSSKHQITIAKLITGTCLGIGIVWLQLLVCFLVSSFILPIHTWNIVIINMASSFFIDWGQMYIPYTYLTVVVFCFLLTTVGSFAISLITLGISYLTKSRFIVVIVMTVFIVLSWFIKRMTFIPTLLKTFMPFNMLSFLDYFYGYTAEQGYPYFIFHNSVIPYRTIVIVGWSLIGILIVWMLIRQARKPAID